MNVRYLLTYSEADRDSLSNGVLHTKPPLLSKPPLLRQRRQRHEVAGAVLVTPGAQLDHTHLPPGTLHPWLQSSDFKQGFIQDFITGGRM